MKVLDLRCSLDHRFEGWFASEDEFRDQLERGQLACPLCGNQSIDRMPSVPRLNVARGRDRPPPSRRPERGASQPPGEATPALPAAVAGGGPPRELTLQSMWLQAVHQVMASTVDVGDRFPEEARRIHYGEAEERAIRGRATREETQSLRDEGIEVMSLPMPDALKGPLQ